MPLTWCFQFHAHFVFQPFMSCYFGKQCPCYLFSTIPSIPYILVLNVLSLSRVLLFVTPWTVAHQAPPSMGFSRQEYWSGCHRLCRLSVYLSLIIPPVLLPPTSSSPTVNPSEKIPLSRFIKGSYYFLLTNIGGLTDICWMGKCFYTSGSFQIRSDFSGE